MNLNELFFFKVFPCIYSQNDTSNIKIHNKNNCYYYHFTVINEKGQEKLVGEDKRREPISFFKFFKIQFSKIESYRYPLNFDTIFELENKDNNFNFYIDSMPLESPNKLKKINFNANFCENETEFNYHMRRYKKNICRFWKINNKCTNEFCYNKHLSKDIKNENDKENFPINNIINNIIHNVNNIYETNDGIEEYNKAINKWREQKGIKLIEIIILYNYILSFENKYLSTHHLNLIQKNFDFFQKWFSDAKIYMNPIPTLSSFLSGDTSLTKFHNKENTYQEKISKNSNLFEALKINTNVCYISKNLKIIYNNYNKEDKLTKCIYAMLNSSDGVIICGANENMDKIQGIKLTRKERDKFKIWFNKEFIDILIKYDGNLKYDFIDIKDSNSDECILVIYIKKIKGHKFLIQYPNKCHIIKEKFLNRNKKEKNAILDDDNIKELDLKEYLEILRIKLLEHYSQKFNVKI